MEEFMARIPLGYLVLACLTLGLAPFSPPHLFEKLQMLFQGRLVRPLDWFDLILHGTPWVMLVIKLFYLKR
ncbi:MAG: RND transporter [Nitrospira sp.]|nr:RND transporter [bacterium]MBL7048497.1 RND transporter [Nitrospira sp.]